MANLSKSKLLAYRQCPKRLWLEVHRPELRQDSARTIASFAVGHDVGALARRLYDPLESGSLIDVEREGFAGALARTRQLVGSSSAPIFEAGFAAAGALAFADILLPVARDGKRAWRMVEIKSSSEVKDYHREDAAIQHFVATQAGVTLEAIAVGHIDTSWTYPGGGQYQGILVEEDVTEASCLRNAEVRRWIADGQAIASSNKPPATQTGPHCSDPFECGFKGHCSSQEPPVEYPVTFIPKVQAKALKQLLAQQGIRSLDQVPDELLNETQRRVKTYTLSGSVYFDARSAAAAVAKIPLPALFLDFETISYVVPIWPGTRPYQQIPFQYSLHLSAADGTLDHHAFLDLTGEDPSRRIAENLVRHCAGDEPVFAYNKGFEAGCIERLALRFPDLEQELRLLGSRLCDLLPVVRDNYYHPSQQGSWSIKKVLPALVPELSYEKLDGVKDGGGAMEAYIEAVRPDTTAERKAEIERQLLAYCHLDTLAMVRMRERLIAGDVPA